VRADHDHRITSSQSRKTKLSRLTKSFSPLTRRILAVNLVAPVLLVLGLLFLDQYEDSLIAIEFDAIRTQGELIAAAIGEGAVVIDSTNDNFPMFTPSGSMRALDAPTARQLIRRLAKLAQLRARLFDAGGTMIADSRLLRGPGGEVEIFDLPPQEATDLIQLVQRAFKDLFSWLEQDLPIPTYEQRSTTTILDYPEAVAALESGEVGQEIRFDASRRKILSVAVPVQFYKQVVGTVLVSRDGQNVEIRLFAVRRTIIEFFMWILGVTILLSLYLAGTIARPVRRLAMAAAEVRKSHNRETNIPDLSKRNDEIGQLSEALREMTENLWQRMDATERFAADVAHEIKNPLSSLHSAVETAVRIQDVGQQKQLMGIIKDDVSRLDRLISDISDASRLDAELSRAETKVVNLGELVKTLAEIHNMNKSPSLSKVRLQGDQSDLFEVMGIEGRLVQVFQNLINNAASFNPSGGTIRASLKRFDGHIQVDVQDEGPGIPKGKEISIFERFYSERPEGEKFGTHSGLGLSISKQIIEAHGGNIVAITVREEGVARGALFSVVLPALVQP